MCDRCLAQQGKDATEPMYYKNFGDYKAWHLTAIHHDGYLNLDASSLTPWLAMEGFKTETVSYDLLHNIFLGTARDLIASGLKTLIMQGCYNFTGLTDLDAILSYVDAKIRKTCKDHRPHIFAFVYFKFSRSSFFGWGIKNIVIFWGVLASFPQVSLACETADKRSQPEWRWWLRRAVIAFQGVNSQTIDLVACKRNARTSWENAQWILIRFLAKWFHYSL